MQIGHVISFNLSALFQSYSNMAFVYEIASMGRPEVFVSTKMNHLWKQYLLPRWAIRYSMVRR